MRASAGWSRRAGSREQRPSSRRESLLVRACIVRCSASGDLSTANVLDGFAKSAHQDAVQSDSSFLKPLKQVAISGSEVSPGRGETWKFISVILTNCCDIPETKDMSAALHGAGRQHLCFRCHSTLKNMVMVKKSSSPVVGETMETRRKVKNCKRRVGSWGEGTVLENGGIE